jgi:hypothetical protein
MGAGPGDFDVERVLRAAVLPVGGRADRVDRQPQGHLYGQSAKSATSYQFGANANGHNNAIDISRFVQ